jgi:hypothetical protein
MDKHSDDVSNAMREIAERRDHDLCEPARSLSPERLRQLRKKLESEFPVETALRLASDNRDNLLTDRPVLPRPLETLLRRRLSGRASDAVLRGALQRWAVALQRAWLRSRIATQCAAAFGVIFLTIAALQIERSDRTEKAEAISHHTPHQYFATKAGENSEHGDRPETWLLRKPGDALTLQISTIELASREPSLFTVNRALLAQHHDFGRGLPLDLPFRQMLIDDDAIAVP